MSLCLCRGEELARALTLRHFTSFPLLPSISPASVEISLSDDPGVETGTNSQSQPVVTLVHILVFANVSLL